jgi:hypothetical protein
MTNKIKIMFGLVCFLLGIIAYGIYHKIQSKVKAK